MPNEWYTSPRGAEERVIELKKAGFKVKPIKQVKIDFGEHGGGENTWLVKWSGRARFLQTTF